MPNGYRFHQLSTITAPKVILEFIYLQQLLKPIDCIYFSIMLMVNFHFCLERPHNTFHANIFTSEVWQIYAELCPTLKAMSLDNAVSRVCQGQGQWALVTHDKTN